MPRLFLAVAIPEEVRENLLELCDLGLEGADWTDAGQYHLTLRFIGEVDGARARGLAEALPGVSGPEFDLALSGVGWFPPRGRPRVLWAGVAPSDPLERLRGRLERRLVQLGLPPDGRRFHPHVTLAKLGGVAEADLAGWLGANAAFRALAFRVTEYVMFSSALTRHGAVHTPEFAVPLEG